MVVRSLDDVQLCDEAFEITDLLAISDDVAEPVNYRQGVVFLCVLDLIKLPLYDAKFL